MEKNTCTFFGHKSIFGDVYESLKPKLRYAIVDLIENHNIRVFLVGNHGAFDSMVRDVLKELSQSYLIKFYVVLSFLPVKNDEYNLIDYTNTLVPDGIEDVPKRFGIDHRNRFMIKQSDYVITYVTYRAGSGAAKYKEIAERKGKTVINLAD